MNCPKCNGDKFMTLKPHEGGKGVPSNEIVMCKKCGNKGMIKDMKEGD